MKIVGSKLTFFSDLYEDAKNKLAEHIERMDRQMAQYNGDDRIDGSSEKAKAIRNITYELIESKVSNEIPSPKVTPSSYNEARHQNARSIERFLARERDRLPFEALNDQDERYTYIFGGSVWLVQWDDTAGNTVEHGALTLTLISPQDFIPQPNIYNVEDMDYCFVKYTTTRQEIEERYGVVIPEGEGEQDSEDVEHTDDKDTVTLIVCYYIRDGRVCKYSWTGDTEVEDLDDFYARRNRKCRICDLWKSQCTCERPSWVEVPYDYEKLDHDIVLPGGKVIPAMSPKIGANGKIVMKKTLRVVKFEDGTPVPDVMDGNFKNPLPQTEEVEEPELEPTKIPFYRPTLLPVVVRKNTSADRSLYGKSDCDTIRPQQQAINKIESRIMDKLVRASVTPVLPEDAEVQSTNAIFGQVIRTRQGENAHNYGVVDTTPRIDADIAEGERLYQQAKMILGITDSYQGVSEYAGQSGKAMQTLAMQSAGRIESTRRMKRFAYSQLDAIAFQFALAYSDEPRNLRYTDANGMEQNTQFSRYDFLEYNRQTGKWDYYDGYTFSADSSAALEQDRQTMWDSNLKNLQAGTFGNPADPATLLRYWQKQERDHYPHANEEVTYFRQIVQNLQAQAQQAQAIQQGAIPQAVQQSAPTEQQGVV